MTACVSSLTGRGQKSDSDGTVRNEPGGSAIGQRRRCAISARSRLEGDDSAIRPAPPVNLDLARMSVPCPMACGLTPYGVGLYQEDLTEVNAFILHVFC